MDEVSVSQYITASFAGGEVVIASGNRNGPKEQPGG